MIVGIVGLGLVGGSTGLILKQNGFASKVIGVDANESHAREAVRLSLVDVCDTLDNALRQCHLVILCIPVDQIESQLPAILDRMGKDTIVVDFGSTKEKICEVVKNHPKRAQFVAAHPIAGTENSGPQAAFTSLYQGKTAIICDREHSSPTALDLANRMIRLLGMHVVEMNSHDHDLHIAYVSHLSHISSFVLGQTVLEIEKDEASIFNLAGSGLESTVRLAKSSPEMWQPIFLQNKKYISDSLTAYIDNLIQFKQYIDDDAKDELKRCMANANDIRRVLDGIKSKSENKQEEKALI